MAEIREVDAETMADIHSYATTGLTLLGLAENTAPKDIVAAITEYVRALKAEQRSLHPGAWHFAGLAICAWARLALGRSGLGL